MAHVFISNQGYTMNLSSNIKVLPLIALLLLTTTVVAQDTWSIKTQTEWEQSIASKKQLELKDGMVSPTAKTATFQSQLKRFDSKRSAQSITFEQSTVWGKLELSEKHRHQKHGRCAGIFKPRAR